MLLTNIRIVLVETSHPGNIGAAARAMKTMGLTNLVLVNPKSFPDPHATALAASAADILETATITDNLPDALADCQFVVGASARDRSLEWPTYSTKQLAQKIATESSQIAIVFGRENSGLSTDELQLCDSRVWINANPEYSSLNLAQAVQIVAYEIYQQLANKDPKETEADLATHREKDLYIQELEKMLWDLGILDPKHPKRLVARLRRLYNKARLDKTEITILRGILSATQKRLA